MHAAPELERRRTVRQDEMRGDEMRGIFARAVVIAIAVAGFAIVSQAPADSGSGSGKDSDNVVVCFNRPGPVNGLPKAVYRTTPGRCMFVRRGRQPIDANSVTTRNLRWRRWGNGHARARGNEI